MMLYLPEKSFIDGKPTSPIEGEFLSTKIKIVPGQFGSLPASIGIELRRYHPEVHEIVNHAMLNPDLQEPLSLIIE